MKTLEGKSQKISQCLTKETEITLYVSGSQHPLPPQKQLAIFRDAWLSQLENEWLISSKRTEARDVAQYSMEHSPLSKQRTT